MNKRPNGKKKKIIITKKKKIKTNEEIKKKKKKKRGTNPLKWHAQTQITNNLFFIYLFLYVSMFVCRRHILLKFLIFFI